MAFPVLILFMCCCCFLFNLPGFSLNVTKISSKWVSCQVIIYQQDNLEWRLVSWLQEKTETFEVQQGETSLQVAVEMPFDIRSIECPTHKIKLKVSHSMSHPQDQTQGQSQHAPPTRSDWRSVIACLTHKINQRSDTACPTHRIKPKVSHSMPLPQD